MSRLNELHDQRPELIPDRPPCLLPQRRAVVEEVDVAGQVLQRVRLGRVELFARALRFVKPPPASDDTGGVVLRIRIASSFLGEHVTSSVTVTVTRTGAPTRQ